MPSCYNIDISFHSYDADDTTVKPEPPVQDFQPELVQAPAPSYNNTFTSDAKQEPKDEEAGSVPVKDEPMYGNGLNGDVGSPWYVGQANGGNTHQYNDASMEQDPAPIGIKEDG